MNKLFWRYITVFIFFLAITINSNVAYAQSNRDIFASFTIAEKIIVESVESGEIADLGILPDETDRIIGAEFFENLLTGKIVPITNNGVNIKNAIIDGDITLVNEAFTDIRITECIFTGILNLQGAKFNNLSFSFCTFQKEVNLSKANIYGTAYFDYVSFINVANFSLVTVGNSIDLNHAIFSSHQAINFNNINIGASAILNDAIFEGPVDFSYARIGKVLYFHGSYFNSTSEADFNSIDVGDSAFFINTVFQGSINFGHARIGKNLDFSGVKFYSQDKVLFNSLAISGSLVFQNAFFAGPVFFLYTQIGGLMDFSESQFASQYIVSFSFLNLKHGAIFKSAIFKGPVLINFIDSGGPLDFTETEYLSSDNTTVFTNLNVRGSFLFSNSSFSSGLEITNVNIENSLAGNNIKFLTKDKPITISRSEAQTLSLEITDITNTIYITNCTILYFRLSGPEDQSINFSSLDLSGTQIMRNLRIENLTMKDFVIPNLMSHGIANIRNLSIMETANLSFANFNKFIFQNLAWPNTSGEIDLDGFTYNEIIPGESLNESNWKELLDLLNIASYNVPLYRHLESYFEENGHSDWADAVLIAQKRRERSDLLNWYSLEWWWSFFLDCFTLFGRMPSRAFLWGLFIIIIGSIIFRREKMRPARRGDKPYNSFLYSLDLFIPYVDLEISNKWEPLPKALCVKLYKRIHLILGWILVPIALLSISGYFK